MGGPSLPIFARRSSALAIRDWFRYCTFLFDFAAVDGVSAAVQSHVFTYWNCSTLLGYVNFNTFHSDFLPFFAAVDGVSVVASLRIMCFSHLFSIMLVLS